MSEPGLFGGEGKRLLDEQEGRLFPATAGPAFFRLLWITLILLAIAAAAVAAAIIGRLP